MLIQLKAIEEKELKLSKPELDYKFEVQTGRTTHWFDLDLEWLENNFETSKPDIYKRIL